MTKNLQHTNKLWLLISLAKLKKKGGYSITSVEGQAVKTISYRFNLTRWFLWLEQLSLVKVELEKVAQPLYSSF